MEVTVLIRVKVLIVCVSNIKLVNNEMVNLLLNNLYGIIIEKGEDMVVIKVVEIYLIIIDSKTV